MKYLALLLAAGAALPAEQFVTGQAARSVIGQRTFTRQEPGASQLLLGSVSGLALVNDTLFVVDSSRVQASPQNNRVLIYRNVSTKFPRPDDSIPWDEVTRCPVCGATADTVLGQPDFSKNEIGTGASSFRTPTAVATDGRVLAVADTDNNRVLIWNSIPTANGQPADIVLGQQDMTATAINAGRGSQVNEQGLRGPQGVWIDVRGRLWVADTQNNRVLMWNTIPTQNGAAATLVLGAADLSTFVQVDLTQVQFSASASNLLNPVSVTVDPDGRVFVSDLGHNRVLVWNSLPTRNGQPADFALGQPDTESTQERPAQNANNVQHLCASNGTNSEGQPTYPDMCEATLNFPRYALSDGKQLFVADGGNNRVLVYNTIPTRSGQPADVVLGQPTGLLNVDATGDTTTVAERLSTADSVRTPMSLAWDGVNLYVSDTFNRRVMVWTGADQPLPRTGVRNAASLDVFAVAAIIFTADPKENDEVTLKVGTGDTALEYKYKATANQTIANVVNGLAELVNTGAGNPLVFARPNPAFNQLLLAARAGGPVGNEIPYTVTYSAGAQIAGDTGGNLSGGQDASQIAPGSIVTIVGENLSDRVLSGTMQQGRLPNTLGGVEVYFDGIRAPLLFVSPEQINAQMPWEVNDSTSVSAYVRTTGADGRVRTTTAIAVPIIPEMPGIFAAPGTEPRRALAFHGSSSAVGVVSVDGSIKAGDQAIVTIADRNYGTTVAAEDTLFAIRDRLVSEINNGDPDVIAEPSAVYTRIVLRARTPGSAGEGIPYSARATEGGSLILTALSAELCCANTEGAPITQANPARPGQLITIYATGLGIVQPDEAKFDVVTGGAYTGTPVNAPNSPIDAIAGGRTANVLFARLKPGEVGLYELVLQLNSDIPTNPETQLTIAQQIYISNIATFPVVNPNEVTSP